MTISFTLSELLLENDSESRLGAKLLLVDLCDLVNGLPVYE